MPEPGDVVVINFPGAQGSKKRPAVIVSSSDYHAQRPDAILGLLTTNIAVSTRSTDYILQDWSVAGLSQPSAFRSFLVTLPKRHILSEVGRLSDRDWEQVQNRLVVALAVPESQG